MRWVALAMILFAPATAEAGWSRPAVVVQGDDGGLTALRVLDDGRARVAIYDRARGLGLGLRDAAPGLPFGPPRAVLGSTHRAFGTQLAADGSGVTLDFGPAGPAAVPFDASGTAAQGMAVDRHTPDIALAVSPAGAAVVAWLRGTEVVAAFREVGADAFGPPVSAGYAQSTRSLVSAGIADSGEAVVTWQANGFPSPLAAAVRLPGAGFSRPRLLSREVSVASLAVGPGGDAIVSAAGARRLRLAVKRAGAAEMPRLRTVDRAPAAFGTTVAAAPAGRLAALWSTERALRVYIGSAAGGLRRVAELGAESGDGEPLVALDGRGRAVVAWEARAPKRRGDPTVRSRFAVAYKPAGGHFGRTALVGPTTLSEMPLALALAPDGGAVAAFESFEPDEVAGPGKGFRRDLVTRFKP